MPQARGDSLLLVTENRETLIHRASELAAFSRKVENGQLFVTNESVTDGNSSAPSCRECSGPRSSQNPRLQAILDDHFKFGPVTGIEVFKSAGTLVAEVQVPSQQPGNSKSWVRISRGNSTLRTTICNSRDWPPTS